MLPPRMKNLFRGGSILSRGQNASIRVSVISFREENQENFAHRFTRLSYVFGKGFLQKIS